MKKLTYDEVKNRIEKFDGYKLISKSYNGAREKLEIRCPKGHISEMTLANFEKSNKCRECYGYIKWNIDKVKIEFEKRNYTLLEDAYTNNLTDMKYICNTHPNVTQKMCIGALMQGKQCKECAKEQSANARRKSKEKLIDECKQKGCTILNPEDYLTGKSIMKFKCDYGHEFEMKYNYFLQMNGCRECRGIIDWTDEKIEEFINNRGFKLISKPNEFKCNDDITVECKSGHITDINWNSFRKGQDCTLCTNNVRTKYTYDKVKEIFEKSNMKLISNIYKNMETPLKFVCINNHYGEMTLHSVMHGYGCRECGFEKASITRNINMSKSGTINTSSQQLYLHNILGGELNCPVGKYPLDIAFIEEKIYLEYDGSGHDLNVKLGRITKEEFDKKQLFRSLYLNKLGWKEIRISSTQDYLPNEDKLIELFNHAKLVLNSGRSWIKFDIDNSKVLTSQYDKYYDFGNLNIINKKTIDNVI